MAKSGAERQQRYRQNKKQREEEEAAKEAAEEAAKDEKRERRRLQQKQRRALKKKQRSSRSMSDDGDGDDDTASMNSNNNGMDEEEEYDEPPPPVESGFKLSMIPEEGVPMQLSEAQMLIFERERIRQNSTTNNAMGKIADLAAVDTEKGDEFLHVIVHGSTPAKGMRTDSSTQLAMLENGGGKMSAASTPSANTGRKQQSATSTPSSAARKYTPSASIGRKQNSAASTPSSAARKKTSSASMGRKQNSAASTPASVARKLAASTGRKQNSAASTPTSAARKTPSASTGRKPSAASTPSSAARKKTSSASVAFTPSKSVARKRKDTTSAATPRSSKRRSGPKPPPPFPEISPTIAMISTECYKGVPTTKILDIGQDAGKWDFDIRRHVLSILQENPDCYVYLVGYRHEERPVIPSIHKSIQIHVPCFLVHVLPKNAPSPSRVVNVNLETKMEEYYDIKDLPFKWVTVATSDSGQKVHMLLSTARTTSRSSTFHITLRTGGQFWYPIPLDKKANPVKDEPFILDDDKYYFVDEMWDNTRARLLQRLRLTQEGITWADFCDWEPTRWLDYVLGVAVDAFFEYEEDPSRDRHEAKVKQVLSEALRNFKKNRDAEQRLYEEHQWYAKTVKHYKIYPENDCLQDFIGKGCSQSISKWCGKPEAVYPEVPIQAPPNKSSKKLDPWGNPRLSPTSDEPDTQAPKQLDLWGNPRSPSDGLANH